jgi:hypothetical protein
MGYAQGVGHSWSKEPFTLGRQLLCELLTPWQITLHLVCDLPIQCCLEVWKRNWECNEKVEREK